ncbi:Crp/Fnr family transcriptional regulator [Putridiphycobacter roseus]|uniref:Crp/Fnr family transcriptional regulator n=1 Tax=Putridiphycobacter roseus TaxID=2219161 RepID=A0A2W1N0U5_9FLAO|nr:Crp/Fnr family transcriptional regulator [Putridiphycobacter roseus]PZE17877.1 Crp/Fnr family transcriptional regulator [Putridiphycobacter roseus]
MEELYQKLKELIGLTLGEWETFKVKLVRKEFDAKTTVTKAGNVAHHLYFVSKGLMRTYHLQAGKEMNTYFACDAQFIATFSSFITQTASFETLEAMEDTQVYELSHQALIELYEMSPKFEKLGRILAEQNYLCVLDRTLTLQTKTAREKYLSFIKNYDQKIVQCVPQHMIATFLGIAPESLSRVRKQILIS